MVGHHMCYSLVSLFLSLDREVELDQGKTCGHWRYVNMILLGG